MNTESRDRLILIFSPEGRIYEFGAAFNHVETSKCTLICIRETNRFRVVTWRNVSEDILDRASVAHLFPVSSYLGLLVTGEAAHARTLVQRARNEASRYRNSCGYVIPTDSLALWIAKHAYKRPLGVVTMSTDEEKGSQFFKCDPACRFFKYKALSAEGEGPEDMNLLEKKFEKNPAFSFEETVQTAISGFSALQSVLQDDYKVGQKRKRRHTYNILNVNY
ncbi:hypothetical protein ACJIZ3_011253 [Penstemon smallii]|uniref:Uncharacterized protein n=1 Tax=Penstemon smallii TaxID=265156 RepID=A0ABD3UKA3_9LAMI